MDSDSTQIKVLIANLKKRKDRLKHIKKQFKELNEFDIEIVEAIEHTVGPVGLWETFKLCVKHAKEAGEEVFIFCEDDHEFTENYNWEKLLANIKYGYQNDADLLVGGSTGGMNVFIPIGEGLIWVNHYYSNQFLIVYEKFFDTVLTCIDFDMTHTLDNVLSEISVNKFVIFPYISVQKEFGYSDVTNYNQLNPYKIVERFNQTEKKLSLAIEVYKRYHRQ